MSMHKILFGSIVFFSLAFLAACGGGGSGSSGAAGAAGAAGATGATGATGSLALFEDPNLLVSFNGAAGALPGSTPTAVPLDSGVAVGAISGVLSMQGLDNITSAESRKKYYMYSETSAGVKHLMAGQTAGLQTESGLNAVYNTDDDGVLDVRLANAVTATNTLAEYVFASAAAADGVSKTTAYFTVCPGNEAGDGDCSKVIAPAYDRGMGTISPRGNPSWSDDNSSSIVYANGSFHVLSDNTTFDTAISVVPGVRVSVINPTKALHGSAINSDNLSANALTGIDNDTRVSNLMTRGSYVCFAEAADNTTKSMMLSQVSGNSDNVTLACKQTGLASVNFADNTTVITGHTSVTTAPQITNAGDGAYVILGVGTALTAYHAYMDNATVSTLTGVTAGTANTWCSTSDESTYMAIASDNTTTGWFVDQVYDNHSTFRRTLGGTSLMGTTVSPELCGMAHLGGTTYLAVTDETGGADNVSVFKSDDLISWTQIGSDFAISGDARSIAVATTGSSASDDGVWVVVNDSGNVEILHYESVGATTSWRTVASPITGAGQSPVSIATDGTSVIAVSSVKAGITQTNFWYNQ